MPRNVSCAPHRCVVAVAVLALLTASCSRSSAPADSIESLRAGAKEYSLVQAQSALTVGTTRFVFGLIPVGGQPRVGGTPRVWVAKDEKQKASGPFSARWVSWSAARTDAFGKPPIPGYYVVDLKIASPGNWMVLAVDTASGRKIAGVAGMPVTNRPVAAIGSRAISESTPVASTPDGVAKIDTRQPPTPMHYISLDAALANGLPTVLVFGTPELCQSRICGPVVDEVLDVYDQVGPAKANFVDVEIYPQRDINKPAPEFLAWHFESEPWTLVIDKEGVIRGRFEGPVVASEIAGALSPLLS